MDRVVVTGGTGNVGAALVPRLPGDVVMVARHPPPPALTGPRRTWCRCDIGAPGAADRLAAVFAGADAVVHLAWAVNPPTGDPPMSRTNVTGSAHVLDAVAAAGVRYLICASSVAAYTEAPRDAWVDERWPVGGTGTAYGRQKAGLESMLDRFADEHPGITVAR